MTIFICRCVDGGNICLLNQFRCSNNNCVPVSKVCNEADDCGDLSDENFVCPPGKM